MKRLRVVFFTAIWVLLHSAANAASAEAADAVFSRMVPAQASSKLSAPVDLRYEFAGPIARNRPVSLRIALLSRVAGENLRLQVIGSDSIAVESKRASLKVGKLEAAKAFHRQLDVTPLTSDAAHVRVLVSMDINDARYAAVFIVPVATAATSGTRREKPEARRPGQ